MLVGVGCEGVVSAAAAVAVLLSGWGRSRAVASS